MARYARMFVESSTVTTIMESTLHAFISSKKGYDPQPVTSEEK